MFKADAGLNRPILVCAVPVRELKPLGALAGCEAVELRLDYMGGELGSNLAGLRGFIEDLLSEFRAIVTVRDPGEGGVSNVDPGLKVKVLSMAAEAGALIDVEVDFIKAHWDLAGFRDRVILSRHILKRVDGIRGIIMSDYSVANSMHAFAYKIATINDGDLPALIELLVNEGETPVAIIPMSPIHRAVSIMLGTALMYCAVDGGTAPGQLSVQDCVRIKGERVRLIKATRNHPYQPHSTVTHP